jgi:DNA repair protein RecO (recombination protein O)
MSRESGQSFHLAFVLHSRPYRETSLLLEIFTKERGRLSLLAKGARTPKSSRRALLQPFTPIHVSWYGRHELLNLAKVEVNDPPLFLSHQHLLCGLYVNELLMHLLPRFDSNEHLFDCYYVTLQQLASLADLNTTLRFFELALLRELGYETPFLYEANSHQSIQDHQHYLYLPGKGLFPIDSRQHGRKAVFFGRDINHFIQGKMTTPEEHKTARQLMRLSLHHLLGGKVIKSRELFL